MLSRLVTFPKRHAFVFSVGITAIKTGGVDYLVQKYVEKKEKIDWRRVFIFGSFGFGFSGVWQYYLFVKIMPRVVPGAASFAAKPIAEKLKDTIGLRGLLIQNFIENGINNPFLFWPVFYTMKEYIEGGKLSNGIKKYKKHFKEDLYSIWALWIPAQFINLSFSPLWMRVPFMAVVSAGWICYVSLRRGEPEVIDKRESMVD